MTHAFSIQYGDQEITISQLPGDQHGNVYYVAHLPGENLTLEYTEDDEGAGHWIDEKTNHETEQSAAIGHLIELHRIGNREQA